MSDVALALDGGRLPHRPVLSARHSISGPAVYHVACTANGEVGVGADGPRATPTSRTFVDDAPIATAFGDVVPAPLADLVDVAVAVYVADRLCRRHPKSAPRSEPLWQRRLHVEVPVRDPARWTDDGLAGKLSELLGFLTDDEWTFGFASRSPDAARPSEAQPSLFRERPPAPASAALFSGGLDSLAGLVARLAAHPSETVVAFSGRTNKRIGAPQRSLIAELGRAFPGRIRPVSVQFGLAERPRGAYDQEESSQRTRGFVFQALGAVTARMAGLDRLAIYENGVGAINLPYTGAQLGSQATRAAHPVTLRLMSALLSRAFGEPFEVELPYAFTTKGELCVALREAGLGRLARDSVSCDGFPQRAKYAAQCGVCLSCVLRRQSLLHAELLADDPTSLYRHDIYDAAAPDARERRHGLRIMGGQAHHLRCALAAERPWDALVARYPALDGAADALATTSARVDVADVRMRLVSLYERYCTEWGAFAAQTAGPRDGAPDGSPVPADPPAWAHTDAGLRLSSSVPAHRRVVLPSPDLWQSVRGAPDGR